jgi:2-dehydro-3-deoxygluconokinase
MSAEVVTLGEAMLRLSPPDLGRLAQADRLDLRVGGAEANVAVALARLGRRVAWISAVPDNPLGRRVTDAVAAAGVDVTGVARVPGARIGLYFVEFGPAPRATEVYYDRAGSAFATAVEVDATLLEGARYAVLSGISLGVSAHARAASLAFARAAQRAGAAVVVDVNHRARVWTPEAAREGTAEVLHHAAVVVSSARDAGTVFALDGDDDVALARALRERHAPEADLVCLTCSERGSVAVGRDGSVARHPYVVAEVVDRFGAGDAFLAGLLDVLLDDGTAAEALSFAARLAALKCTVAGDLSPFGRADVDLLAEPGERLRR